jgi:hypothetical protein
MEIYYNNYDKLNKYIVYNFGLGCGGIGDLIKFFIHLLNLCIKYNIKIYYLVNNIIIEKYLKLKYEKMYITREEILNNTKNINNINDIPNIVSNIFYMVDRYIFYGHTNDGSLEYNIYPIQEIFYFSNDVIKNIEYNEKNYISIHLRLGDKYLETDKSFVKCPNDVRGYNEDNIFNLIEKNYDNNILFFCDNNNYKLKIKNKYSKIIITNYDIGHTSFFNTTDIQVLNSITEFYLITNSEHIYCASYSGFSIMASKFKNTPISKLY